MKINHISYISEKKAYGKLGEIYKHIKQDFGKVAEPFVLHSSDIDLTAAIWSLFYETVLVDTEVKRSLKEAVATCVSEVNKCRYCVDAHSIMLFGTDEKLNGKIQEIKNNKIVSESRSDKIIQWALSSIDFDADIIKNPPFAIKDAPEIIGTVIIFNYINRMVTVFAGETPLPVSFWEKTVKKIALKLYFRKAISKNKHKGESLVFISGRSHFAGKKTETEFTMSHFRRLIYKNIETIIPDELKKLLKKISSKPGFLKSGSGKTELADLLQALDDEDKQIAEFCFLMMFEPYKVYQKHIARLKQKFDDREILYLASFCSFIIAENIGNELYKYLVVSDK